MCLKKKSTHTHRHPLLQVDLWIVLKWCWLGYWPVLGAKAVPRQLEDLEAKAEEDWVLVAYRPHENPQDQSLQDGMQVKKMH